MFGNLPGNEVEIRGGPGSIRTVLLVVLLVTVASAAYIYFFTGVVTTHEGKNFRQSAQPAMVKKPLPARLGAETVGRAGTSPGNPSQSVAPVVTKPNAETGEAKKAKPVADVNMNPSPKARAKVRTACKSKGGYALIVGEFVLGNDAKRAEARLKKAAVFPISKRSITKPEPMHRVFVAEFGERKNATTELESLKKLTPDAFILPLKNRYQVFAGSYYRKGQAEKERDRLCRKGMKGKLIVQKVIVRIPVTIVTAGNFTDKPDALKVVHRLREAGFRARVISRNK